VIELVLDGEPNVEDIVVQDGSLPIPLPLHVASVTDIDVRKDGSTDKWKTTDGKIEWSFRTTTPGDYEVIAITKGSKVNTENFGNHEIRVTVGNCVTTGTAGVKDMDMSDDAPWTQYPRSSLGTVRIDETGDHALELVATAIDPDAGRGLKLLALELVPVNA